MTTTDDILALAARATATEQADGDLELFGGAVARGMDSDVARRLRALRPPHGAPPPAAPAMPESPAWDAWLWATAAITCFSSDTATDSATAMIAVCAAATALGDDCSAAVAAGTQAAELVESRLAGSAGAGWSVQTVSAAIGAGLAAGMMLGLPAPQLRNALGICATQAAGLRAAAGTEAGPLQVGKAAFNAVEAAQLARLGFTSSAEPLDGRRGLIALFCA